ncbi:beta-ketoacyl-[acyl-carrier-protein] synthase family protein [Dokdonia sp. Hel_I_53]|uniref:beta-ketoacyl-[acyl-carrier-protein] synthase family protein n=1 Tax=Dokdonia sp. Hel_I_53 TaxID=1566287 RepID=UPI0011994330|nr:beta-ketoacyl-[acyl-carrier-protein] synthase family protein [Dokdonia sp. Hel_I_53]TVZ51692.1 3-oxoacyl-(acyl-carrier-protein) synthase [Dokdonia sp. Hel_I_53]
MKNRVVITGMGVCAPNGIGLEAFSEAIFSGKSGVRFHQKLADLNFGCQIAGEPSIPDGMLEEYFTALQLKDLQSSGIEYGMIAGVDAWCDAGLSSTDKDTVDYDSGIVFGVSLLGAEKFRSSIYLTDEGKVRRLGSTSVVQTMASGISAYLGGYIGCGNQVTTNSSACTTGLESVFMGYERIRNGHAVRMLVGSCNDSGPYIWGGFDAMRVLTTKNNDQPEHGSRPMQADANGFVPGAGAGALVLETLESAQARGAKIYAEVLGGAVNSGGQRNGGTMTAPNSEAVQRCIKQAVQNSGVESNEIDTINGHLTSTGMCPTEVKNWSEALELRGAEFPYINSLKSMTGHCLAAAGSIEAVATILEIEEGKIFGNINANNTHPDITECVALEKIPQHTIEKPIQIAAKASFGFGDVNCCMLFKKFTT